MIKKLIFQHKWWLALAFSIIILISISSALIALFFQKIVSSAIEHNSQKLINWSLIELGIIVIYIFFYWASNRIRRKILFLNLQDTRSNLEKKLTHVSYKSYHQNNYFKNAYIYDSFNLINNFLTNFFQIIYASFGLLANIIALFLLQFWFGILGIATFLVIYAISFIKQKQLKAYQKKISNKRTQLNHNLDSSFQAFKRLYLLNQTSALTKINLKNIADFESTKQKFENINNTRSGISMLICKILEMIFYITIGVLVFTINFDITKFVSIVALIGYILFDSKDISMALGKKRSFKPLIEKIEAFLALTNKKHELKNAKLIEAKDLHQQFDNKILFQNLNFKLKQTEKVLIFGRSGKGKSTLVNLLLGIIKPSSGKLSWNKQQANIDILGDNVAYIKNKPLILQGTLDQNITLFDQEINLDKLAIAKEIAQIDFNLEDANKLSTGQKQRLEIASALYCDAPTIIFDESLANIDHRRSALILDKLLALKEKRIIIISHHLKPQQMEQFDQIINLNLLS